MPALQFWLTPDVAIILAGAILTGLVASYLNARQAEKGALQRAAAEEVNGTVQGLAKSLKLPADTTLEQISATIIANQWAAEQREHQREEVATDRAEAARAEAAEQREIERRERVLARVQDEWISSRDDVTSAELAGNMRPPKAWTNRRLKEMGENFHVP